MTCNALPYLASFIHHSSSISLFFACSIICAKDPEPDRDTLGKLQIVSNIISLIFRHPSKWDGCSASSDLSSGPPDAHPPPEAEEKPSSRPQLMKVDEQSLQKACNLVKV